MRRSRTPIDRSWPRWMYSPTGEGQIFQKESDVPEGWVRKIGDVYVKSGPVVYDYDDLVRQLNEKNIEINPIWGLAHMKRILDGDVSPTG